MQTPSPVPDLSVGGESIDGDFLTLRDGTTAQVRVAGPEDRDALDALLDFFRRLSPGSRWRRFFSPAPPSPEQIASLCRSPYPQSGVSLVVTRTQGGEPRVIATGCYQAKGQRTAEVALAVDDAFQGKGLGTLLLERLALLAVRHGFTHFWAVTHADNQAMHEVFQESGFAFEEGPERGEVEMDLSIVPTETTLARLETRHRVATVASLRPFFRPKEVAVVGASRKPARIGHRLLDALVKEGFPGPVYPVNPKATEVRGLRAYPSVRELPEPADLAVIAVPRDAVLGVVDDCAARGVRAVVVVTSGFAEVGPEGRRLQQRLVDKVRGYGMRLIGPNCLGLLSNWASPAVSASATGPTSPATTCWNRRRRHRRDPALPGVLRQPAPLRPDCPARQPPQANRGRQGRANPPRLPSGRVAHRRRGRPRRGRRCPLPPDRRHPRGDPGGAVRPGRRPGVSAATRGASGRRLDERRRAGDPLCGCLRGGGAFAPELSAKTRSQLATFLPTSARLANPVDMIASATPEHYRQALQALLGSGEVDALIAIHVSAGVSDVDTFLLAIQESTAAAGGTAGRATTVLACLLPEQVSLRLAGSGQGRLPCFAFPEAPARVLGKLAAYAEWKIQPWDRFRTIGTSMCLRHAPSAGKPWTGGAAAGFRPRKRSASCRPCASGSAGRGREDRGGGRSAGREVGLPCGGETGLAPAGPQE